MFEKKEINEKLYITYSKSIIRGILLSVILLLISAAVFFFTTLDEQYLNTSIWVIIVLSICYASMFASLRIGNRGFLHGAAIGAIYIFIIALIAFLAGQGQINMREYIIKFFMSIIVGSLAGIIGIIIGNRE